MLQSHFNIVGNDEACETRLSPGGYHIAACLAMTEPSV